MWHGLRTWGSVVIAHRPSDRPVSGT